MSIVNQAREISCEVWESSVIELLWCDRRQAKKWADLYLDDETNIEVKCRLYGQPVNVLVEQLLELRDSDIYALVYYRMLNWIRPVKTIKMSWQNRKKWLKYLRNMMQVSKVFLFPRPYMIDFYNNSAVNERVISSSGLRHKWLSVTRAEEIYEKTREEKRVFETPLSGLNSIEATTFAVWEKITEVLLSKWYKTK